MPKLYVPRQNSCTKCTSLGCWLAPETTPVAQNCDISAVCSIQAPNPTPKIDFGSLQNPHCKNAKLFHGGHHRDTRFMLVVSKTVGIVQDRWPKGHDAFLHLLKKYFSAIWCNPKGNFSTMFVQYPTVIPH